MFINENYQKLGFLACASKILKDNTEAFGIVAELQKLFAASFSVDNMEIYVYDENTRTLRDFSKSWVVIDEFHKNADSAKLYISLAKFLQHDFLVNDLSYKMNDLEQSVSFSVNPDRNTILFSLMKGNKPFGMLKLDFNSDISSLLTKEFFTALFVFANQISLKIQNMILAEQMQVNIDFHEAMKNVAKIIETQYELNYIIPLIGEMVDRFISDHLIYIFLKRDEESDFELFWPGACRDKKILDGISQITSESKYMLIDDGKIGIFPLIGEKSLLGCVVAHSNIDKLTKNEIEYLNQLTKQSSITIHRANVYAEVLQHATLDALTGLNNRRQFELRLKQEVSTSIRQDKPLCAIMLDVDFFKKVNDTYGHVAGDIVLKNVAALIKQELREYDIASRYGGEEFAILLPFTKIEEAFAVAQRLRNTVENTQIDITEAENKNDVKFVNVTVSIGVYQYKPGDTEQDLYANADKALYEAKTHGRNKVVIFNR